MKDVNSESRNIDVAKGKRILKNLTDSEESEVYYKAFNEAYHDLTSCLRKPRYIDPSKFFCSKCDPNYKVLDPKGVILTNKMLDSQVWFEPHHSKDEGIFIYRRNFKQFYKYLPLGYNTSEAWAHKFDQKLKKLPKCNQELNYRLNMDYINERVDWFQNFIKTTNTNVKIEYQTFLPTLLVHNPKSKSTPLRLVQTPNIPFKTQVPVAKGSK